MEIELRYRGEGKEVIHNLIIHKKEGGKGEVFGDINGEARYIEYSMFPMPKIKILPLKKLPAGYLSEREFVFLPVQPEVLEKMIHVLLISPFVSELSIVHDTVYLRSLLPEALRSDIIRVRDIVIRNRFLVLRRGQRILQEEGEFTLKDDKKIPIPIVEKYRIGREVFVLHEHRTTG